MNKSISETLQMMIDIFYKNNISEPEGSAKLLLSDVLGIEPKHLFFEKRDINQIEMKKIEDYIKLRLTNKPVAYIVGRQNFRGRDFFVDESVLIPRFETEEIIDHVSNFIDKDTLVIDLGTGSGVIPISIGLELDFLDIYAFEKSKKALEIARKNSKTHNVKINFINLDVTTALLKNHLMNIVHTTNPNKICITANLPYISLSEKDNLSDDVVSFEPHLALFGGNIGDELILSATSQINDVMNTFKKQYFLIHEIDDSMSSQLNEKLNSITTHRWSVLDDLSGKHRFLFYRSN